MLRLLRRLLGAKPTSRRFAPLCATPALLDRATALGLSDGRAPVGRLGQARDAPVGPIGASMTHTYP